MSHVLNIRLSPHQDLHVGVGGGQRFAFLLLFLKTTDYLLNPSEVCTEVSVSRYSPSRSMTCPSDKPAFTSGIPWRPREGGLPIIFSSRGKALSQGKPQLTPRSCARPTAPAAAKTFALNATLPALPPLPCKPEAYWKGHFQLHMN